MIGFSPTVKLSAPDLPETVDRARTPEFTGSAIECFNVSRSFCSVCKLLNSTLLVLDLFGPRLGNTIYFVLCTNSYL